MFSKGDRIARRDFIKAAGATAGLAALQPWRALGALAAPAALPSPAQAPFDHVVVLMMENRSFDHFLGWLPGANGRQAGLAFTDTAGNTYPTYDLHGDYQGCGYADPDHSWEGGVKQLDGGRMDGFLKTAAPDDTFPIGYYTEQDVPVLGALARNYTVSDNYFCSILAETYPNRFYQHSAQTDRDHNGDVPSGTNSTLPTIWDRLAGAGLSGGYYYVDLAYTLLWGDKYFVSNPISFHVSKFLADCAAGNLPNLAFVDPSFAGEGQGVSGDAHPHGDIRVAEAYIAQIYNAVRTSPNWSRTVMILNFDEWGGFYDHVVPPRVIDASTPTNPKTGPHPDYRQLGFRVPNVVISPFSAPGRVVSGGAPFEHTSVLKMIEWRWGLAPLSQRDANARNLAEMLDFSLARSDTPSIPMPVPPPAVACGPTSTAPNKPRAIAGPAATAGAPAGGPSAAAGGGGLPGTATAAPVQTAAAVGAVAAAGGAAAAMAARYRRTRSSVHSRQPQ